jgi:hypothetical protein
MTLISTTGDWPDAVAFDFMWMESARGSSDLTRWTLHNGILAASSCVMRSAYDRTGEHVLAPPPARQGHSSHRIVN